MIIRLLLLNKSLLLTVFAFLLAAQAQAACKTEFDVLERNGKVGHVFVTKKLENLKCNGTFEGTDFKVVLDNSDHAISFDADEDLLRRAATTYYYLTESKKYWVNEIKSDYVKKFPPITIRINISRKYSKVRHFHKNDVEFNNAWTVRPGQTPKGVPRDKQKSWGHEVWFNPMKVIDVKDMITSIGNNPVTTSLKYIEGPIVDMANTSMMYDVLDYLYYPEYYQTASIETLLLSNLITIVGVKGIVKASEYLDYVFVEDEFYIDSALVPEVIMHEFAHIALSDKLLPRHSLAAIEGMADYFVASSTRQTQLYRRIDDIILAREKDALNTDLYSPQLELSQAANRDFALSVIWSVRTSLEKLNSERQKRGKPDIVNVDELVYNARKFLKGDSKISPGLTGALVKSCQELCRNRRAGVDAIRNAYQAKGFN